MKFSRAGENLWMEWDGYNYSPTLQDPIIYFTEGLVDIRNDVVKRALASYIQRDGLVNGLGEAYRLVEDATALSGQGLVEEGELVYSVYDSDVSYFNASVPVDLTWVEVPRGG